MIALTVRIRYCRLVSQSNLKRGIMVKSSKGFKAVVVAVLMGLSVLLSACGDMGGDCTGDNWVGHASECAYRLATGK